MRRNVYLAFLYAEIEVNMDQIKDMISKLIDIEEDLFLHYSEIPTQFNEDMVAIDEMIKENESDLNN